MEKGRPRTLRKIDFVIPAIRDDIGDLKTVRPIPSPRLRHIDPFLLLNHHGPQIYPPGSSGLPFGPHPHRGFQTVTFILDGDIAHRDSGGGENVIQSGGVQWMSAGRGLVHEEVSSAEFMQKGGALEILQLWVNLPARLKMSEPYYLGLQRENIPVVQADAGRVRAQVVAGEYEKIQGAFRPAIDITLLTFDLKPGATLDLDVAAERSLFFYLVRGLVEVNGVEVASLNLVHFTHEGSAIHISASVDSYILFGHAQRLGEPIVMRGPFVMNSDEEIRQAFRDFF